MMDEMRNLKKGEHLNSKFLEKLDELTVNDFNNDKEFLFAPHIVTSRYEREIYNWEFGKLYSRVFKEPMLF